MIIFKNFALLAFFSFLIGLVIGIAFRISPFNLVAIIGALIFKHMRFLEHHTQSQIMITFLLAYCGYIIADLFSLSGVIALLMAGIALEHYSWHNLSEDGKHASM